MVIFLGDYLDSYESTINRESFKKSFENLKEIIEFKKLMKILVLFCLVITNLATWLVVELAHNLRRHFQYKRFLKENISKF